MKLYFHLAWDGIRKNRRLYVPYLLTGVGAAALFYILLALANGPAAQMNGGDSTLPHPAARELRASRFSRRCCCFTRTRFSSAAGTVNSRLYNVLGMGKGNIARILVWETLLSAGIALLGGLTLGAALSKLAELVLTHLMGGEISYSYPLSGQGALLTALLFAAIYVLILLVNIVRIRAGEPRAAAAQREPRGKSPRARTGCSARRVWYCSARPTGSPSASSQPLTALVWFFIAVVMVILATYLLFIAGSVVLCRLLQKNKRFYYQKSHFVSVSSMAYRMKRNGAGLASICILATMVLVMLSSTTCLYSGIEDSAAHALSAQHHRDGLLQPLARVLLQGEHRRAARAAAARGRRCRAPKTSSTIARRFSPSFWTAAARFTPTARQSSPTTKRSAACL